MEISISTPDAVPAIRVLSEAPATVGAGDVAEISQAKAVIAAGARFVSCAPGASEVIRCRAGRDVAAVPPATTAGARNQGAAAVRVSHSALLQSSWAADALRPIPLVASGALDDRLAGECIRAGARAVRAGDRLFGAAAAGGHLGALGLRARRLVTAVSTASLA